MNPPKRKNKAACMSMSVIVNLHNILWANREVLAIFSHVLKLLIPTARLAHIERIFSSFRHPRWIITIIIDHSPEYRVPVLIELVREQIKLNETSRSTHPMPLYMSYATLFPARTYRSTNQASLLSDPRSSCSVSLRANPSRRQAGATVSTVMCPCHGV
jgi:hypothetical protein